jgi:threonyl-tRNA synthetase
MLIVGDKEMTAGDISVRLRSGEQQNNLPFSVFKKAIGKAIMDKTKGLEL